MALERNSKLGGDSAGVRDEDRFAGYDADSERSHFGAFLMGGFVVTAGLLAFLYYDTDNLNAQGNRDLLTTGSISRLEAPATPAAPSVRVSPPAAEDTSR